MTDLELVIGSGAALVIRLLALDRFHLPQRWSLRTAQGGYRQVSAVMVEERNRRALPRFRRTKMPSCCGEATTCGDWPRG